MDSEEGGGEMRKHMMLKWDEVTPEPLPMNQAVNAGRFDDDPFKAIRRVYRAYKDDVNRPCQNRYEDEVWKAISETIKIVGEEEK
jgi:hypothetical protein